MEKEYRVKTKNHTGSRISLNKKLFSPEQM